MKTYKVVFVLLAATVLLIGTLSNAIAGADSLQVPYATTLWVPCALDGAGEYVDLTGTLHIVSHTVIDKNGGFHTSIHSQPQGVSGEGQTSGDMYQGTGVTRDNQNIRGAGLPVEFTYVNNFRIIGQGPDNNFLVHTNMHYTINANGELTANVLNESVECK